jgi:hypothetical protein
MFHIARPRRVVEGLEVCPEDAVEGGGHGPQVGGAAGADVDDLAVDRRRPGRQEIGLDDVADEHEIARLPTVAEDDRRLKSRAGGQAIWLYTAPWMCR